MTRKKRDRDLKELYDLTHKLSEPEITPVLKGSCRIQGPMDDTEHDSQTSSIAYLSEKGSGKYLSRNFHSRAMSGTCNVCAAPCSSCMHYNQTASVMESNVAGGFTEEASFTNAGLGPLCKRLCDDQQHTASEASNLVSGNSSHDSFSENADSKATSRMPDGQSHDVDMPLNRSSGEAAREAEVLAEVPRLHNVNAKTSSNQYIERPVVLHKPSTQDKEVHGAECHGDHTPYVSGVGDIKNSSYQDTELKDIEESSSCQSKGVDIPVGQKDCKMAGSLSVETIVENKAAAVDSVCVSTGNRDTLNPAIELVTSDGPQRETDLKSSPPHLQPQENTESETNEPDLEDDVKVCDICGDAGIEEKLAICSRCSDGAEHTYCMRIMLDKVPDGDWLCEGCKFKEDAETKKVDKSEASGIGKAAKGLQSSRGSSKRLLEGIEVTSVLNRKAPEAIDPNGPSSGTANSNLRPSLNRDNSSKSLDTTKMKLGVLVSDNRTSSIPNSLKTQSQLQSPRGTSLKPSIDSLKPKVKQVQNVPPKTRLIIESTAADVKKERVPTIGKSASFKSTNPTYSNMDSTSKTHSTKRTEDTRNVIQGKQRGTMEKKSSFILDRSHHSSSAVAAAVSVPLSKADPKITRSDGKVDTILTSSKVSEDSRDSVGFAQARKQLPYTSKSSGILSGKASSVDQKSSQGRDDINSSSNIVDKKSDAVVQHGFSQSGKFVTHDEKKDIGSSRHQLSTGGRILRCQRCNETGHASQFCSVDKLRLSALKPSNERISKDVASKNSKWKDAVEAAISRTRMYKHNKLSDQLNELPSSSNDMSNEVSPNSQLSNPSAQDKISATAEGTVDMSRLSGSSSKSITLDVKQHILPLAETAHVSNNGDSAITAGVPKLKPAIQMLPEQTNLRSNSLKISVIPEFDYIWQGCFEVQRSGRVSEICDGVQAHLSTCASPRVIDVVAKFPRKIQLEEVSCMSSWPSQFQSRSPTEENIALFFFATDYESHEKNYKKLLENMLKNDMALKGKLDGVDLLIFPSNKLPERSQRWNRLFFLWGVFRANKSSCLVPLSGFQQISGSFLNGEKSAQDFPPLSADAKLQRVKASETVDEESSISDKIKGENNQCKIDINSSDCRYLYQVKVSSDKQSINSYSEKKMSSTIPEDNNVLDNCHKEIPGVNTAQLCREVKEEATCLEGNVSNLKTAKDNESGCILISDRQIMSNEVKTFPSCLIVPNGPENLLDPTELPPQCSVLVEGTTGGSKSGGELNTCKRLVKAMAIPSDSTENSLGKEQITSKEPSIWDLRPNRKRSYSNSPEPFSQTSTGETISWKEQEYLIHNEAREPKKIKLYPNEHDSMKMDETSSYRFSSKVHPVLGALGNEDSQIDHSTNDIDFANGSLSSEQFFLSGSSSSSELQPVSFIPLPIVSPVEEDALDPDPPSLELALGAEKKPLKQGILPLFFPVSGNEVDEVKPPDPAVDDEDDMSASLSLSLAFPFPEKKQTPKRTEQLLPEQPCPNSSLILFGSRFTDT